MDLVDTKRPECKALRLRPSNPEPTKIANRVAYGRVYSNGVHAGRTDNFLNIYYIFAGTASIAGSEVLRNAVKPANG